MNLTTEKRAQILNCFVEGCSMRSTGRLTGAAKKTVERLLVAAGTACAEFHDKTMRNLDCKVIQLDEIWAFCGMKEAQVPDHMKGRGVVGDIWLWTAIDADTKIIASWHVGTRNSGDAQWFLDDLASRLKDRVQITSDGLASYPNAVERAFGSEVDFAQLVKTYEHEPNGRYSPANFVNSRKVCITGEPLKELISTSYVERSNLTWRMTNRRFTRLTNAFSKKAENHAHSIAISMVNYNFCRIHQTLRVTPAMAAGVTDRLWSLEDVVNLIEKPICSPA